MALRLHVLLVLFVLCFVVRSMAQPRPSPPQEEEEDEAPEPGVTPQDEKWIWCVPDTVDLPKCQQMVTILATLDPESDEHNPSCIVGDGDEDCMRRVQAGEANYVVLDGGEIYEANKEYGLVPIRTEVSELEGSYYSVGIVKKGKCPGSLKDLKGKRSCHTGYGRSAGWVLPVSYLIDNKIMPTTTGAQTTDIESVKAFFSKSCAADNNPSKTICTACKVSNACTEADAYYDYEGAFRGLVEDACDVAFTKHTIPAQYSKGGVTFQSDWKGLEEVSSYQILCPSLYNGQLCTDASNYKSCNFGKAPGHAIMVSGRYPAYEINEFNNVMDAANSDPSFINLFFSGNNVQGSIFAADATRTVKYAGTTQQLLGSLYNSIQDIESVNSAKTASNLNAAPKAVSASIVLTFSTWLLYVFLH